MEQENYKKIAEIIKARIIDMNRWKKKDRRNVEYCGLCMEEDYCFHDIKIEEIEEIANKLADYFEKEKEEEIKRLTYTLTPDSIFRFHKKQFLKDCGVEK